MLPEVGLYGFPAWESRLTGFSPRFDDTNPSGEEGVYFDSILEMVRWLGFEPWKITYSSDNFAKLYQLAMKLTKKGMAYICHCDRESLRR